jgi:anaerobic dimethyl sulfoxide reductase subunit B (iron-sulfur subunit)
MTQLGFYFDSDRCTSCKSCVMACKDKNDTFVGLKYRSLIDFGGGTWSSQGGVSIPNGVYVYGVSYSCMHCIAPACIAVCPTDSIQKREEDGVVWIEQSTCIGCGSCAVACPYAAPRLNAEKGVAGKCDFCKDYLDSGGSPACVDACIMRCLEWGDIEELRSRYGDNAQVDPLSSPDITGPNYIVNPSRFWKEGVGGSVINAEEELI